MRDCKMAIAGYPVRVAAVFLAALAIGSLPAAVSAQDENAGRVVAVAALPSGRVGQFYVAILLFGGVPPYSLYGPSGPFPPGLTIGPRGEVSGTPTRAAFYRFFYKAQDASNPPNQISGEAVITIDP
jgi:hypothetical protein